MGYGAPLKNQNKGYAAQEKKDLLNDNPVAKVASGGSWMSKHISSPLAMGKAHSMAPKMESPMEKELVGKQKNLPEGLKKAIEASPAEMHGTPMHQHVPGHSEEMQAASSMSKEDKEKMKKNSLFGPDKPKPAKPPKGGKPFEGPVPKGKKKAKKKGYYDDLSNKKSYYYDYNEG
jgi:hypothetical protein